MELYKINIKGVNYDISDETARFTSSHSSSFNIHSLDELNNLNLTDEHIGTEINLVQDGKIVKSYTLGANKELTPKPLVSDAMARWFNSHFISFVDPNTEAAILSVADTDNDGVISRDTDAPTLTGITFSGNTEIEYIYELDQFPNLVPQSNMFNSMPNLKEMRWVEKTQPLSSPIGPLFANCPNIRYIDLRGIDVSNLTKLNSYPFRTSDIAEPVIIDIRGWDTSNFTSLAYFLGNCYLHHPDSMILGLNDIDTSNVTNFASACGIYSNNSFNKLRTVDLSNWDLSKATGSFVTTFGYNSCAHVIKLPKTKFGTNVTNCCGIFNQDNECQSLENTENLDLSSATRIDSLFSWCSLYLYGIDIKGVKVGNITETKYANNIFWSTSFRTIIGDSSMEDVLNENIKVFDGIKVSFHLKQRTKNELNNLERPSLRAIINGLADLTDQTSATLSLMRAQYDRLKDEDIAVATNKNWSIAIL